MKEIPSLQKVEFVRKEKHGAKTRDKNDRAEYRRSIYFFRVSETPVAARLREVSFLSFTAILLPIMIPPYEKDRTAVRSPVLNGLFVCL